MLWDYLKTLITLRLTLQAPCMCAGCKRGRVRPSWCQNASVHIQGEPSGAALHWPYRCDRQLHRSQAHRNHRHFIGRMAD